MQYSSRLLLRKMDGNDIMTDQNNASFYYSVNMLRALLAMKLITEEEYKKIVALNAEYYGVEFSAK